MRRARASVVLVLLAPLLAGCFYEPLDVVLTVRPGERVVLTGAQTFEGSILVEGGGTLVFEDADVRIAQALMGGGRVESFDSTITFSGPFDRQEARLVDARFENTTIRSLARLNAAGVVEFVGGSVGVSCVRVDAGRLASHGAEWSIESATCDEGFSFGAPRAIEISADASFENGTITFAEGSNGIRMWNGTLLLANGTLDASDALGMLLVQGGAYVEARSMRLLARDLSVDMSVNEGRVRLVDSPLPRNALPTTSDNGRIEIAWTLTARAVSLPGGIPVGGLNLTLTGAHDPNAVEDKGTTDEKGEARLIAIQYVYSGAQGSRSGNPHVVRADGGGKTGASPAVVVEGPTTVIVPVIG